MKEKSSVIRNVLERLARWLRGKPEPEDPYAYHMAPVKRPPRDRNGAAVAELDDESK